MVGPTWFRPSLRAYPRALLSLVLPCAGSAWTQSEGRLVRQVRQNNHPQWRGHHGLATSKNRMPGAPAQYQ
jgi:hypothetical protein